MINNKAKHRRLSGGNLLCVVHLTKTTNKPESTKLQSTPQVHNYWSRKDCYRHAAIDKWNCIACNYNKSKCLQIFENSEHLLEVCKKWDFFSRWLENFIDTVSVGIMGSSHFTGWWVSAPNSSTISLHSDISEKEGVLVSFSKMVGIPTGQASLQCITIYPYFLAVVVIRITFLD